MRAEKTWRKSKKDWKVILSTSGQTNKTPNQQYTEGQSSRQAEAPQLPTTSPTFQTVQHF